MTKQDALPLLHQDDLTFEIELLPSVPKGIVVVALIPGTPRKVAWSSSFGTLEAFNRHVNETISGSTLGEGNVMIGLCYIDHIFVIPRPAGKFRLLLQWARQIAVYRANQPEIKRTNGDVPLLISTDSHSGIRAIYPLIASPETRYLPPERVVWVTGASGSSFVNIFSCETPPPPARVAVVVPMTNTDVINHRVRQVLPQNEIPVSSSPYHRGVGGGPYRPEDFSEEQMEDSVREFFSVGDKIAEADAIDQSLVADVMHLYHHRSQIDTGAAAAATSKNSTSDGEILMQGMTPPSSVRFTDSVRMHSPNRRTIVPVGLLPREEHRLGGTGKPRVGIKPRHSTASNSADVESSSEQ